jgi:hypothetical protein
MVMNAVKPKASVREASSMPAKSLKIGKLALKSDDKDG